MLSIRRPLAMFALPFRGARREWAAASARLRKSG
jgi:hypothetical protein